MRDLRAVQTAARNRVILARVAAGVTVEQIAEELGLSVRSVQGIVHLRTSVARFAPDIQTSIAFAQAIRKLTSIPCVICGKPVFGGASSLQRDPWRKTCGGQCRVAWSAAGDLLDLDRFKSMRLAYAKTLLARPSSMVNQKPEYWSKWAKAVIAGTQPLPTRRRMPKPGSTRRKVLRDLGLLPKQQQARKEQEALKRAQDQRHLPAKRPRYQYP